MPGSLTGTWGRTDLTAELLHRDPGRPVQTHHPACTVPDRLLRERLHGRESPQESEVERDGALHLYLLQHHLRDEDAVGVARGTTAGPTRSP